MTSFQGAILFNCSAKQKQIRSAGFIGYQPNVYKEYKLWDLSWYPVHTDYIKNNCLAKVSVLWNKV